MMSLTDLRIFNAITGEEIILPAGADTDISQSLEPIDGALDLRRDVNGGLIVIQNPLFRKYRSEIAAKNLAAPALGDTWGGSRLTVHSVAQLTHTVRADGTVFLTRDPVPGSIDARDAAGNPVAATRNGRTVSAPGAAVVHYRPVLSCVLTAVSHDADEMTGAVSWSLELEEA